MLRFRPSLAPKRYQTIQYSFSSSFKGTTAGIQILKLILLAISLYCAALLCGFDSWLPRADWGAPRKLLAGAICEYLLRPPAHR